MYKRQALNKVGVDILTKKYNVRVNDEVMVDDLLKLRLKSLCESLKSHYAKLLGIQEIEIENFYENCKEK